MSFRDLFRSADPQPYSDVTGARLYEHAQRALTKANGDVPRAAAKLAIDVKRDHGMLVAMARAFLLDIASDGGEGLPRHSQCETQTAFARQAEPISSEEEGGGHLRFGTQGLSASASSDDDERGHLQGDHRLSAAPSSSTSDSARGQISRDAQRASAAPLSTNRGGAGQIRCVIQSPIARPVREPSAAQRAATLAVSRKSAETILDTFKVRDGRGVGELNMAEVRRLARENGVEHHVLVAIAGRYANAAGHDLVRDLIKPDVLEQFIRDAREAADVA